MIPGGTNLLIYQLTITSYIEHVNYICVYARPITLKLYTHMRRKDLDCPHHSLYVIQSQCKVQKIQVYVVHTEYASFSQLVIDGYSDKDAKEPNSVA